MTSTTVMWTGSRTSEGANGGQVGGARVIAVRVLAAERRTPVVIVHVVVGPLLLVLGVVRLRRRLQVRPPMADGGGPAIGAKPEVWEPIEQAVLAAVQVDPAAWAHVLNARPAQSAGRDAAPSSRHPSLPRATAKRRSALSFRPGAGRAARPHCHIR